jgi:hypothetical protein
MYSKKEILNNYGFFQSAFRLSSSDRNYCTSLTDWDVQLVNTRRSQLSSLKSIYELGIKHGRECTCCSRIVEESRTRPTKEDNLRRKTNRGRPRLRG